MLGLILISGCGPILSGWSCDEYRNGALALAAVVVVVVAWKLWKLRRKS